MKNQVRAYFAEAKWLHEEHVPTFEEYMRVALVSSGYCILATTSFVGMGEIATKEAFDWVTSNPKIMSSSNFIARLMDDIKSHKVCIICYSNGENKTLWFFLNFCIIHAVLAKEKACCLSC